MKNTRDAFVFGFAVFASFFGAGNLILPPFLGLNAGPDWWLVALGFAISAVIIPLLALMGHARLQGTMMDFGLPVSRWFSLLYCLSVYGIAISLPVPRTAAVTHEMAVQPFFDSSSLLTSSIYFGLVLLFVINRSTVLQILGKYLTPLIAIILAAMLGVGLFGPSETMLTGVFTSPLLDGLMEGYQTYDALGGVVIGGVVTISLNIKGYVSFEDKKWIIVRSGIIAASGLFLIYGGLIFLGAIFSPEFDRGISRTALLSGLSLETLGQKGSNALSLLVALACFTTAVSVVVGTADFIKGLFNESRMAYMITAILSCLVGVLVGQFNVKYIIDVAIPALMFIYPLTIVLILLNVLPKKWRSKSVFRWVVLTTFGFSIPDFMRVLWPSELLNNVSDMIPFSYQNLGWVIPALSVFLGVNLVGRRKGNQFRNS